MAKETTKPVIILSGPLGAGKTTVAQEFIKSAADPIVYIEGDRFWQFFVKDLGKGGRNKNFKIIMSAMTAAAIPFALGGYTVLLDFSIPPWFLETAKKIAGTKEVPLEYIILRPTETVCAERAATRNEGVINDYNFYHELYTSFDEAQQYIIHDDVNNAAHVAGQIRAGLITGRFRIYK